MNKRAAILLGAIVATLATLGLGGCSKPPEPTVAGSAAPAAPAASSATGNVADIDVKEHVTTALQQSEALKGFDITVVTLKGDVRLIGVLDTQTQIDEAIRIARAADGAHTIHDELTIKK